MQKLDISTLRCPMALLTVKRWVDKLDVDEVGYIFYGPHKDHKDVIHWLTDHCDDVYVNPDQRMVIISPAKKENRHNV